MAHGHWLPPLRDGANKRLGFSEQTPPETDGPSAPTDGATESTTKEERAATLAGWTDLNIHTWQFGVSGGGENRILFDQTTPGNIKK